MNQDPTPTPTAAPAAAAVSSWGRVRAHVELAKLRLSALAVFAVVAGLWLGDPDPSMALLVGTTLGTLLGAAGANAANMFLERDVDPLMRRTAGRPLPTGRLRPAEVATFAAIAAGAGLMMTFWVAGWLATVLLAAIVVSYVAIYTPMKRRSTVNTLIGAIPGALPPVVGYAAATGRIDTIAVLLFGILYAWQVPHFLAIAWRHREDYRRGGLRMLPVVDPQGRATARQMLLYGAVLVLVSLLPGTMHLAGEIYLLGATLLGVLFYGTICIAAWLRREDAMRLCFLGSIVYLPLLLTLLVLDRP